MIEVKIGIIGMGRIGYALAQAILHSGLHLNVIADHQPELISRLIQTVDLHGSVSTEYADLQHCDLLILSVPDGSIASVVHTLIQTDIVRSGMLVVHCSGASPCSLLQPAQSQGAEIGVFHPLIAVPRDTPDPGSVFSECYIGISGSPAAIPRLTVFAQRLGAHPVVVNDETRSLYHLAAVMAANFPLVLLDFSTSLFEQSDISTETARAIAGSLMTSCIRNFKRLPLPVAVTGPIARGDVATVEQHMRSITDDTLRKVYQIMSTALLETVQADLDEDSYRKLLAVLTEG